MRRKAHLDRQQAHGLVRVHVPGVVAQGPPEITETLPNAAALDTLRPVGADKVVIEDSFSDQGSFAFPGSDLARAAAASRRAALMRAAMATALAAFLVPFIVAATCIGP